MPSKEEMRKFLNEGQSDGPALRRGAGVKLSTEGELRNLSLDQIIANDEQARTHFDEKSLKELADNIKLIGVLEPILVRPVGDIYQIVAGERRYRAVQLNGGKTIPAIIKEMSDVDALIAMTTENLQREDLDIEDEARNFQYLLDNTGLSQRKLAERLGIDHNYISRRVRMLKKPELLAEYRAGLVSLYGTVKKAEEEKIETVSQRHTQGGESSPSQQMNKTVSQRHNSEDTEQENSEQDIMDTSVSQRHREGDNPLLIERNRVSLIPATREAGSIQTTESMENPDLQALSQIIQADAAQFRLIFDRWSNVLGAISPTEQSLVRNSIEDIERWLKMLKKQLKGS